MSETVDERRGGTRVGRRDMLALVLVALALAGICAVDLASVFLGGTHKRAAAAQRPTHVSSTQPPPAPPTTSSAPPAVVAVTGGSPGPACTAPATVMVPDQTEVATLSGNTPGSDQPGVPPDKTVPASWYGYPSVLPVVAAQPGWLQVREAQRPNGATAWIPSDAASLSTTPYAMVLNLCTAHLLVFQGGQQIFDFPAGIGAPNDPTVTGQYFIAMTVPPPGPGYGPFVLATSAHSDTIRSWEGMGDAIVGIHGPITAYDDRLIGTSGAAISHGCIRLHNSDLAKLSVIPAGTPLQIVG